MANKSKKSTLECRLLQTNEYTLFREDERPHKPRPANDRNRNRYDGPHDKGRNKRKRSDKDKRHVSSKKVRNLNKEAYASDSSSASGMSRGNYSSDTRGSNASGQKNKKDSPVKTSDKDKKSRMTRNSPIGLLIPKSNKKD